jgi:hypothetical protein
MAFRELTVDEWTDEINYGLKYRQKYGNEKAWADLEAIFYNVHNSQMNSGPNIIFSTADALLSELLTPKPYLTSKARHPEFINGARLQESVDNTLIDDMGMRAEVEGMTLNAYIFGVGVLKIGFDSEYGWDPKHDLQGKKNPAGATLTQFDPATGRLIEFADVQPGMPWVKSVDPRDFVVPWGTKTIDDCPWVAHRIVRHIDDVKSDAKYRGKTDLQPNMSMADFVRSYQTVMKPYRIGSQLSRSTDEGPVEYVEMWEIHDKRTKKIYVIATGHDKFLRNAENLLQIEGLPFVSCSFTPKARTFWTTSDAHYLKVSQAELSDISVQQTRLRRAMSLKFLFQDGAFDQVELAKFQSNEVGIGVKVNRGVDLKDAIAFVTAPANYELANQANQVLANVKQTIGMNANTLGEYQSGRKSATEVNAVQEGAGQRMTRRQTIIRDVYVGTFKKINPMLYSFWRKPRIQQVVGQDGAPIWVQFSGLHLRGEYSYECGFSSTQDETLEGRRQQALQVFQMLSQDPRVDPVKLAQYLANAYNDPEFSFIFKNGILNGVPTAEAVQALQSLQQQGAPNGGGAVGQPQLPAAGGGVGAGPGGPQQNLQSVPVQQGTLNGAR